MSRQQTRRTIRRTRRALDDRDRREAARLVAIRVIRQPFFRYARRLAFYVAADGELDPEPLMLTAANAAKDCFLPIVTDRLMSFRVAPLAFQHHVPGDSMARNRFGILEPVFDARRFLRPELLDVMFVPLVAFDRNGNRLGMGAGFYDRTLKDLHRRFRRPTLVGLAYSFQEVDTIRAHMNDVPLDAIVTEREILWSGAG